MLDSARHFWPYVTETNGLGCWLWSGTKTKRIKSDRRGGYGISSAGLAHRLAWSLMRGKIPSGHEIDHLCFQRACVNPDHLRVVERGSASRQGGQRNAANDRMASNCQRGHEWSPENTRWMRKPNGITNRQCRECIRMANRRARLKRKGLA